MFFATVAVGGVFCNGGGCFLRRFWWEGIFFLRRPAMFFASVGCVFCVGGVFCDATPCFLRRLARGAVPLPVLLSVGNPCFLRRPEEVMFFATVPASAS